MTPTDRFLDELVVFIYGLPSSLPHEALRERLADHFAQVHISPDTRWAAVENELASTLASFHEALSSGAGSYSRLTLELARFSNDTPEIKWTAWHSPAGKQGGILVEAASIFDAVDELCRRTRFDANQTLKRIPAKSKPEDFIYATDEIPF